jgi:hypothetical protein
VVNIKVVNTVRHTFGDVDDAVHGAGVVVTARAILALEPAF